MAFYQPGEVVWAYFPFNDSPELKPRPVLIVSIESDSEYKACMITGTDLRGKRRGLWIEEDSELAKKMGLSKSSFINLDSIKSIRRSLIDVIKSPLGEFPEIDDLLEHYKGELDL